MVIVLMGIILSMMTLSVGDGGKYRKLEEEANRLTTLITMAKEEVILRSQEWAIAIKEDGYQFEREEVEEVNGTPKLKWTPISDKIFRARELPEYRLSVVIEDIESTVSSEDNEEGIIGRVRIYSTGEMDESELTIRQADEEDHFILKATPLGKLSLRSSRDDER